MSNTITNLSNQFISASFQPLLQVSSSGDLYDGLGNAVNILNITASYSLNSTAGGTGGSDKQIQFNSSGSFSGDNNFTFDYSNTKGVILGLNSVSGAYAIAHGSASFARGNGSHAEGLNNTAYDSYSHAEGFGTTASGFAAHSEGFGTIASGNESHAEGYAATSAGSMSHAEGAGTTSIGTYSHAEGEATITAGVAEAAHAEGYLSVASASFSHAEGINTLTTGYGAHSDGVNTTASATGSRAGGAYANASHNYEWSRSDSALGQYGMISLSGATTTSSSFELSIGNTGVNYFTIPSNTAVYTNVTVIGGYIASPMNSKSWTAQATFKNTGSAAMLATASFTSISGDAAMAAGTPTITASGSRMAINVTGVNGISIRWFARVDYTLVSMA